MNSVSIVIPAYNSEFCIKHAIESIRAQLAPNDSLIVVDDGSQDNTVVVLCAYEHQPWFTLIRQENGGPSAARNAGIAHAKGDYICFLDSDDISHPGSVAKRRQILDQNPDIDFVFADHFVHRTKGVAPVRRHHESGFLPSLADHVISTTGDLHLLSCAGITPKYLAKPCIHLNTIMVRRKLLLESGGFDERLRCAEDTDFVLRLFWNANLAGYIDAPLSDYNRFTDGISSVSNRAITEHIKFFCGIHKRYGLDSAYIRKRLAAKYLDLSRHFLSLGDAKRAWICWHRSHDFVPYSPALARTWVKLKALVMFSKPAMVRSRRWPH